MRVPKRFIIASSTLRGGMMAMRAVLGPEATRERFVSSTVEAYIADPADPVSLILRVAVTLQAPRCFCPGEIFIFGADARSWIGAGDPVRSPLGRSAVSVATRPSRPPGR